MKPMLNFDGETCEKIWNFEDENVILNIVCGAHPISYPMGLGGSFPGANVATHLVLRSKMVELDLHSPHFFMVCCLVN
jgi:hypothetical protein